VKLKLDAKKEDALNNGLIPEACYLQTKFPLGETIVLSTGLLEFEINDLGG
jgi:hypothetical protein